jgi:hypothetical protein
MMRGDSMRMNGTSNERRRIVQLVILTTALVIMQPMPSRLLASTDPDPDETEIRTIEYETVRIGGPFEFPWSIAFLPDRCC